MAAGGGSPPPNPWDTSRFVGSEPAEELICSLCFCVLNKPVETTCRHVFCRACLERYLRDHDGCPQCDEPLPHPGNLRPALPALQNLINRLRVRCEYHRNGCPQQFTLEEYSRGNHGAVCPYRNAAPNANQPVRGACEGCRDLGTQLARLGNIVEDLQAQVTALAMAQRNAGAAAAVDRPLVRWPPREPHSDLTSSARFSARVRSRSQPREEEFASDDGNGTGQSRKRFSSGGHLEPTRTTDQDDGPTQPKRNKDSVNQGASTSTAGQATTETDLLLLGSTDVGDQGQALPDTPGNAAVDDKPSETEDQQQTASTRPTGNVGKAAATSQTDELNGEGKWMCKSCQRVNRGSWGGRCSPCQRDQRPSSPLLFQTPDDDGRNVFEENLVPVVKKHDEIRWLPTTSSGKSGQTSGTKTSSGDNPATSTTTTSTADTAAPATATAGANQAQRRNALCVFCDVQPIIRNRLCRRCCALQVAARRFAQPHAPPPLAPLPRLHLPRLPLPRCFHMPGFRLMGRPPRPPPPNAWICHYCTYQNEADAEACEVCMRPRQP